VRRRPCDLRQRLGAADVNADLGQIVEAHGGGKAVADAVAEHISAPGKRRRRRRQYRQRNEPAQHPFRTQHSSRFHSDPAANLLINMVKKRLNHGHFP
jgi:hypothetical protein